VSTVTSYGSVRVRVPITTQSARWVPGQGVVFTQSTYYITVAKPTLTIGGTTYVQNGLGGGTVVP
jgi:hypothetical protein